MGIDLRPNYKELLPLLAEGKLCLFMTDERKWGIYEVSGRYDGTDIEIRTKTGTYRAPGYEYRDELYESVEYVRYDYHASAYYLTAVFDTKEQADAVAHQLMAMDAKYEEETRAARLAYEMGLLVALEGAAA